MEKNPIAITGTSKISDDKNIQEVIKDQITSGIANASDKKHTESILHLEGERAKSEKEIKRIEAVETYLGRLFDKLGLPHEGRFIEQDQIHFLSQEVFEKNFSQFTCDVGGFFRAGDRVIFMNDNNMPEGADPADKEITDLEHLTHECIHLASHAKTLANIGEDKSVSYGNYRTGYRVLGLDSNDSKFNGFNEGVVCATERLMLLSEVEDLKKRFHATEPQLEKLGYGAYVSNQVLVHTLNHKIAEFRKEKPVTSLTRIIRSQFTGEMMHLRDIEDIYGKDSLDLLAKFQSSSDSKINEVRDPLILKYFQSEDSGERIEIKEEIEKFEKTVNPTQ
jgi:hypothetical protein